jgi:NAD(P)-dependent dehydrogenase (short-subunit alcohol dehydrogenase family)
MNVVSFSDLQLRGKATVESWLRDSANRVLVVRRRDAEDLVLTTASRAAQAREASSVTSRIFVALMQRDPHVRDLVADVVPEVFPWVAFLSRDEVREFVVELVSTMKAAESIDNPAPVAQVIDSWRHTAEVLADPELAAVLSVPSDGDYGPVPAPEVRA